MTNDDLFRREATAAYDEWETQVRRAVPSGAERASLAREFEKLVLRAGTERSSVWLRELREHAERAALGDE